MLVLKCDNCKNEIEIHENDLNHVNQDHVKSSMHHSFDLCGHKKSKPKFEVIVDSHFNTEPKKYVLCSISCLKEVVKKWEVNPA